ncbi:dephospho-CoA kinase [Aeribacillus sp. FSL K6-1121]|uniref:AAA family ATPase n=1 Tax=Aeribacillus sp. FSL K6-1121 TaxID=2954745 RepID=UPI0030F5C1BF
MNKPPIKLALCGKLRSGKSLVAGYLSLMHDFQPFAFGDALKNAFHRAFPQIPRQPKPRAYYQSFGQWARATIGEDVWIDATMRKVDEYLAHNQCNDPLRVLIEDVRQQNEYDRLKREGFVFVRISAPDELRLERARKVGDDFTEADLAHETELLVDTFAVDYEVLNDGTVDELCAKIDVVIRQLTEK